MSGRAERRLLVLCYFFPPLAGGGVHRILGFTQHLPAHGWAATVVCAGPGDYWVTDPSLEARIHPGTEVVRVRGGSGLAALLALRGGAAQRAGRRSGALMGPLRRLSDLLLLPDSYAPWARRAACVALEAARARRFDAVLSSSPPDSVHLAARTVARTAGLPWVADFRDPWIGLHFREPPTGWHRARQARMERSVLEGADLVLAASRTHADTLGARSGATARRAVHLPNGFEPAAPPAAAAHVEEGRFTMVFTGTLSQMSDTEQFLDALHDVLAHRPEARRRIRVHLCGPYDVHYENRAVALGLTGIVRFTGALDHAATRGLQRAADLLLLWKPRHGKTMVPGKTYEYLDAGRPVLALLDAEDEAAALVRRAGGTIVDPADRAAIARAIETRYVAWTAGGRAADVRPGWLDAFTRAALTARLASELDTLVPSRA